MSKYTEIKDKDENVVGILRDADKAAIPLDPANSDYQRYLRWLNGEEEQGGLN